MNNTVKLDRKKFIDVLNNISMNCEYIRIFNQDKKLIIGNELEVNYIEYELGSISIPNNLLLYTKDLLSLLPKINTVEIELEFLDNHILVNSDIVVKIQTEVILEKEKFNGAKIYIPASLLIKLLTPLIKLIKQNKLTENDVLRLEAIDNILTIQLVNKFAFVEVKGEFESYNSNFNMYLYRSTIVLLYSILSDDDSGLVQFNFDNDKRIIIEYNLYSIFTRKSHITTPSKISLEAKFSNSVIIQLNTKQLNNILTKVCLVSKNHDFKHYTKIFTQDEKLYFVSKNNNTEIRETIVDQTYIGNKVEFAINSQTFKDCLNCCETDELSLYFITKGQPIKLKTDNVNIYLGTFSEVIF
jgi:hypothetical protein